MYVRMKKKAASTALADVKPVNLEEERVRFIQDEAYRPQPGQRAAQTSSPSIWRRREYGESLRRFYWP
jgi:hypothetical protein